jgi:hypothetical protein
MFRIVSKLLLVPVSVILYQNETSFAGHSNLKPRVNYVELEIGAASARLFPRGWEVIESFISFGGENTASDISKPETWDWDRRRFMSAPAILYSPCTVHVDFYI